MVRKIYLFTFLTLSLSAYGQSEEWLKEALQLVNEKRFSEALAAFDRSKELVPNDARPYFYSGIALAEQGYFKEAAAELKQAMRLSPDQAEYPLAFAKVASKLGQGTDALQALAVFEKQEYLDQLLPKGLWVLSDLFYSLERFDNALKILERIDKNNPDSYPVDSRRGEIYLKMGDLDSALLFFEKATKRSPTLGPTYYGMGQALWLQNKLPASREVLRKAVELDPSNPEYLYLLGVVSLALNETGNAIEHLKRAENAGAASPKIYLALGRAYRQAGDREKADEYQKRSQEIDSVRQKQESQREQALALLARGQEQLKKGEVDDARDLFDQAVQLDSENWRAHSYLAKIYISSGYWTLAYQHLCRLQEITPNALEGKFLMATYWYKRDNLDRALSYAEEAKARWPGDAELRNLLGNIYLRLGQREKALEEYRAAVRLNKSRTDFLLNYQGLSSKLSGEPPKN